MSSSTGNGNRQAALSRLAAAFSSGNFVAAEGGARELLAADVGDEEALHLLAQILNRQGRVGEAVELMAQVCTFNPFCAAYHNDRGVMLASLGRWPEAAEAYAAAVTLDPGHVDARFNLALALFRTKRLPEARAAFDQLQSMGHAIPDADVLHGELLRAEGRPAEAVEALLRAIARGVETAEVHVNLGLAFEDMNRGEEAEEALLAANRIAAGQDAAASFHLGNLYRDRGRKDLAEQFYGQALRLRPDFAEAYNNLGLLLQERGEAERAQACFDEAVSSDPALDAAHTNRGGARLKQGWMDGAIDSFKRALEINPESAEAWNNLGNVYYRLHRLEEAEAAYRHSIKFKPSYFEADLNLGILLLLQGKYAEGWPSYESRWKLPGVADKRPKFAQPEWSGDALGERTLLVYSEQGMGDNLQFVRYLPLLRQRYPQAKIYLWCLPPLFRLFSSCAAEWGIEALPPTVVGGLPPFDVQVALLSLPMLMGTDLGSIPDNVPYIRPDPILVKKWATRLQGLPGKKVGVVWASGEIYAFHRFRTVKLRQLQPLLAVDGVSWVSLQKGGGASQIESEGLSESIFNVMDEVEDFADTAALIANLDLVISVDTSVPHLVGAMGVPVWLLDRFDTDWRWLLDRSDSPWYPSMRIFRQTAFGDWNTVMPVAARALAEFSGCRIGDTSPGAEGGAVPTGSETPAKGASADPAGVPLKLNLGCGGRKMAGFVNVDCVAACQPDLVVNLEQVPWPWENDSVDEIVLHHVLEHLGQRPETFLAIVKEMYRVCRDGARIEIVVPHPRSDNFLGDPTHVRPVTAATLVLFDQRRNRQWAAIGAANTPLGQICEVDFELVSATDEIEPEWFQKRQKGQISEEELAFAIRHYNNVVAEIRMVWRARKGQPE